jgi:O-acetylserine/cysteine efflux transporter
MVVKKAGKVEIIAFLAYSSLFAVPILALFSLYFDGWTLIKTSISSASLTSVYVVLWQTIGNTLIGYGLWNYLLSRHSASVVTPWALLVPISGLMASFLILDEAMPFWKILSAALVLSGLFLNIYSTKKS